MSVRAVRLTSPIRIDGSLSDEIYRGTPAITDFIQQEPQEGEPATERTEAWLFFDDTSIYVSARCWDSHPEWAVANEMRRDGRIAQNEHFSVVFDTFHDRRNGLEFHVSQLGGMMDVAIIDETHRNVDWNTVWNAETASFEGGWTVEMVIPFKSLRYSAGANQVWGINLERVVRWKNEISHLAPLPAFLGERGLDAVSMTATLFGLDPPAVGRNLELKPYVISNLRTDRTAMPRIGTELDRNAGFDLKYGITKGLTADVTYRTDFAQVEDDRQQVNLTRFSLMFPEKREFFLEGQGIFDFGIIGAGNNTPQMFFSRRIGLNKGRPVPIQAGARLTGDVGKFAVGALNIQTSDEPATGALATNFSVVRVKRDILRRSYVGAIYTRRSIATLGTGAGETFGVDALYSLSRTLSMTGYLARTRTQGLTGDESSRRFEVVYDTDRYGGGFKYLVIGKNFNPEVGFMRRTDANRLNGMLRFSPRPKPTRLKAVRKFTYQVLFDHFTTRAGRLDTQQLRGDFNTEFQNSDRLSVGYSHDYEFVPEPFEISTGVTVPVDAYRYHTVQTSYRFGDQRRLSGQLRYEQGTLYNGSKRTFEVSSGRFELSPQISVEPSLSLNRVNLPYGIFTSTVASTSATFAATPRMFVTALIQYDSSGHTLNSNVRVRWEYRPGSELFFVYSDGRDTLQRGYPGLMNRTFIVKANRLFRF